MSRQRQEATAVGNILRPVIDDMCRARIVSETAIAPELIAHALSMLIRIHKDIHAGAIEKNGERNIPTLEDYFSGIAIDNLIIAGEVLKGPEDPVSTFDILKGTNLTNQNLAKCLFLKRSLSLQSPGDNGFLVSLAHDHFKIEVSVEKKVISFFFYIDEMWNSLDEATMNCALYNSKTDYVKAHIVDGDKPRIHFTYLYPHRGMINVLDVVDMIERFINEAKKVRYGEND